MAKKIHDYLSLLIAIQGNPFGTMEELADAAGISKPTAIKRLRVLQGEEPLDDETPPKRYFVVKPLLSYHKLGLEEFDVLIEVASLKHAKTVEKVAREHPYTAYRSRCFGSTNGLLVQFRIPRGTRALMEKLLDELREREVIRRYQILTKTDSDVQYTSMSLDGWDDETRSWTFDWEAWHAKEAKTKFKHQEIEPSESLPSWFSQDDLHIIREMMIGSRRMNTDIIESLKERDVDFTPQTFSRHLQVIKDEFIDDFRVTFAEEPFDILNSVLVTGRGRPEYLHHLFVKLEGYPIPFESTFRIAEDSFFWFVRLPQEHISPFLNGLFDRMLEMKVSILDYKHSLLYHIWPETFDEETGSWRSDRSFMVDEILDKV